MDPPDPIITKKITGLSPSTTYEYKIRTQCDTSGYSPYSAIQTFTTNSPRTGDNEKDNLNSINNLNIYPNPANEVLNVTFQSEVASAKIEIVNITGQVVYQKQINANDENYNLSVNIASFATGVYSLRIINENGITAGKFVKQVVSENIL